MNEIYVVLGVDDEGNEGVACYADPESGMMHPMVGGEANLDTLKEFGQALAIASHKPLELVKFTQRTEVETFEPYQREDGKP